jgi:hypothetical protein
MGTPNIALQPTSPASPSPRLSAKTLGDSIGWRRHSVEVFRDELE